MASASYFCIDEGCGRAVNPPKRLGSSLQHFKVNVYVLHRLQKPLFNHRLLCDRLNNGPPAEVDESAFKT